MRYYQVLYLGLCHAYGWQPTDEGLEAFLGQIDSTFRDGDGRIRWEDFKSGMEKGVQGLQPGYDLQGLPV